MVLYLIVCNSIYIHLKDTETTLTQYVLEKDLAIQQINDTHMMLFPS